MSLVVLTGGARSGKSRAAQALAEQRELDGAPVTVVVFGRGDTDPEFADRVEHHRAHRPTSFGVIEAADPSSWMAESPPEGLLLVDCLGTLLGLVMESEWPAADGDLGQADAGALPPGYERAVGQRFTDIIDWLCGREGDTIVVTNEAGDGIVPAYATARLFRDLLGRANRALVGRADTAYLVVAGRLIDLASLPVRASWPAD